MTTISNEHFKVRDDGRVRHLIFDRPEKLNAITLPMEEAFFDALRETRKDPNISVVVVKGMGRAFSAGHDLNNVFDYEADWKFAIPSFMGVERYRRFRDLDLLFSLMWDLPQPLIAQVQGYCYNYALILAMNCDFVFASTDAKFVFRAVGGAGPEAHLLPWLIGPRRTKEFMMLGEPIVGAEAARIGMINRAVEQTELGNTVDDFAARLAKVPLELLAFEKKAVNVALEMMNVRTALGYTSELHVLGHMTDPSRSLVDSVQREGWKSAIERRDRERYGKARTQTKEPPSKNDR